MRHQIALGFCVAFVFACGSGKDSGFGADSDGGAGGDGDIVDPFADAQIVGTDGNNTMMGCIPDPGNFDVPNNNCDDDADGTIDNAPNCDNGSLAQNGDANAFAKSLGLCQTATGGKWGVVSATYVQGNADMHGILKKFGNALKPREGKSFGVLSSGWAAEYDNCSGGMEPFKGGCPMTGPGMAPPGFPKAAQGCVVDMTVNDVSTAKLQIKVPNNAKGLQFDFNFGSGEWPEFVCTTFNDTFIAYLKSSAFNNGNADNISFDSKKNPVSVNNGFFDRCSPKPATTACLSGMPKSDPCAGGDGDLQGTGFYDLAGGSTCGQQSSGGGMTGWLTSTSPVKQGETITIEFMVWDVGDQAYDSSVILDNFQWIAGDTQVGTVRPPS